MHMPSPDHETGPEARRGPEYRPELIVMRRVASFSHQRRDVFHSLARQWQLEPPAEGDALFDAIDAERWDALATQFDSLRQRLSDPQSHPHVARLWPVLFETYLVVTTALAWPAQSLLEFGRTLLSCLRPGMVYLGGTDPGRAIPTLLDETGEWSETGRHIMLTQNSLVDVPYLDYVQFRFGDQLTTPTREDAQCAQAEYAADLKRRREHDAEFPNEPAQVRPGEDHSDAEGTGPTGAQTMHGVVSVNEKLLEILLERNLGRSFAMEESFPFMSFHASAAPLGPILELHARRDGQSLSQEQAQEAVGYWQNILAKVIPTPADETRTGVVRSCYAKLASSQAGLLLHHQHRTEAEQILEIAADLDPVHPEVVFRYVNLLLAEHRLEAASVVAARAAQLDAGNPSLQNLARHLDQLSRG